MIVIRQRKILESPVEPKNKNWLWLNIEDEKPVLRTYSSGEWIPFQGGSVKEELQCDYDEITRTLIIE